MNFVLQSNNHKRKSSPSHRPRQVPRFCEFHEVKWILDINIRLELAIDTTNSTYLITWKHPLCSPRMYIYREKNGLHKQRIGYLAVFCIHFKSAPALKWVPSDCKITPFTSLYKYLLLIEDGYTSILLQRLKDICQRRNCHVWKGILLLWIR